MDYKYKRVAAPFPPHVFTPHDSSSSHNQSAEVSPTHHKQSSLSLHQPVLPSSFSPPTVHTAVSSASSAPPTTTHTQAYSRFPAVIQPRPFSSAQSVRPRIVRTEDDDEDGEDGTGSMVDGLSDTGSAFSAFSRSREELDRIREERELRLRESEKRQSEEKVRLEKVAAVAQKATQMRLRAASAELAKRKEEEEQLRAVVAQVQAREEKQRQVERARQSQQTVHQRGGLEQAERRLGEDRKEEEEKREMEKVKEASMRREHSNSTLNASRVRRESQATSPPLTTTSSPFPSSSASLLPPTSAASKRSIRSDLLASSLPSNPSYYPTHIHSLLSTSFLPPLSRLFKHYHQRAPSSSASPAYIDMAGGVRASVLSSADWLLMMSECGVSGVLLSKDGLKRVYMVAVRTERKRGSEVEMKDEQSEERRNGLGLGRFLKSLWCVARSVGGNERVDDSESARQEADIRVMLALLEYIRHHATPQRLGAQLKLVWPDMTLKEAVDMQNRATPTSVTYASTQQSKPVRQREEKKEANIDTGDRNTGSQSTTTAAPAKAVPTQPPTSLLPLVPAVAAPVGDDAAERERKERKRLRLKLRVEQYRREQEEKERTKTEDERRRKAEEEEREAERRRKEERVREEEKRRIAEFKARRKEEVDEMARAEAEKAEREERERKRALDMYVRQKAERKRREEAEQRQRLLQFHQQLYAQEAVQDAVSESQHQQQQQLAQKDETKRRQWDKRPLQNSPQSYPASSHSLVASPPTATRIASLSSAAQVTHSSPPSSFMIPAADRSSVAQLEDDLLSLGGQSAGLDSVDANEETF